MARLSPHPAALRMLCDEAATIFTGCRALIRPLRALARAAEDLIPAAAAALRREACAIASCPAL